MTDLYPQKSHLPTGPLVAPDFRRMMFDHIHTGYYYYVQILNNVLPRSGKVPKTPKLVTEYVGKVTEKDESFVTFTPIYKRTQGRNWSSIADPRDDNFLSLAIDLSEESIPTGYAILFFRRVTTGPGIIQNVYSRNMSAFRGLQMGNAGLVATAPFVSPRPTPKTRKSKNARSRANVFYHKE